MFQLSDEQLQDLTAIHTVREIQSQPKLWHETLELYKESQEKIHKFLDDITEKHGQIRVIFTGAGTSQYVGDTAYPYLLNKGGKKYIFESIATTDIVANPREYLIDVPTLLVSFARSGNSPESLQAVKLADQVLTNIYHLAITCAPEGQLATGLTGKENAFVFLTPALSNDKGFAMTSSFSCMLLSTLLIFDNKTYEEKAHIVDVISKMGQQAIDREEEISSLVELDFDRIVYLGSGALKGLTREAQLKILELTAGKIATCFDSSMGFRHGPKSFVDGNTLVFAFISTDDYTRKYDLDIVNEIYQDKVARKIVALTKDEIAGDFPQFTYGEKVEIPDGYLALAFVVFAQTLAVLTSLKVENKPDTPSANGTVNRVVKGVIIHELQ